MKYILLPILALLSVSASAQHERCGTPQAIQYQDQLTPGYAQMVRETFESAKANQNKSNSIYTIPVVIHVVYNTPEQNLPDSVLLNQIEILNQDYNRENPDTVNLRSEFLPIAGDPQIKFQLAQIDENGMPTTGITRTSTGTTSFGSLAVLGGSFTDLEMVKSTVDGGHDPWDQSRYMNIWICNMAIDFFGQQIPAILGYATPPPGLPNWPGGSTNGLSDGVVLQFQAVGSNNPNPLDTGGGIIDVEGRTATHEVGHYLGLRHIWGDGDCTEEDGVNDTPNADAESQQDCDPSKNTCTDNIIGMDLPDMIENYMDYSAETCQNSFTQGQADLMHGVLDGPRFDLVNNNPASIFENDVIAWNVLPNPTDGMVRIESEELVKSVEIFNPQGERIVINTPNAQSDMIDLSSFAAGVYIVRISNGVSFAHKRIVLQ
ncbi:zinc-dependent metalloprotease [Crocinitomicaceae bacterium]|nr:zinc-dependent metalloprotease [Crocinitomicaceae bacterium]